MPEGPSHQPVVAAGAEGFGGAVEAAPAVVAPMLEDRPRIDETLLAETARTLSAERAAVWQQALAPCGTLAEVVEIARALATAPKFILLDEPFAGVDPISVGDIKQIIHHLKAKGIGVLITDHNVRETLDICENAYIVSGGHIIASGNSDDILANQQVKEVYLGNEFRL